MTPTGTILDRLRGALGREGQHWVACIQLLEYADAGHAVLGRLSLQRVLPLPTLEIRAAALLATTRPGSMLGQDR
jgi:hypothetical protein